MSDGTSLRIDLERAQARYRQAPESMSFLALACAYRDAGQPEEAVRILQAGLARHPHAVSALVLLGECYVDLHQDESAEGVFARVLELDAENLVALRYRAECARRRGALERAVEILRAVLEADPFDREVQADLGLLATALEREARESRALRAAPPEPPTTAWLEPTPELRPSPPPLPPPPPAAVAPTVPTEPVAAPAEPGPPQAPVIDLRRVGQPIPEEPPPQAPEPGEPPDWTFVRRDDRIVVAPFESPLRGPIRSVEDRLAHEQRPEAPRPPVEPPPAPPVPTADSGPPEELATLTLASIYESQGYLQKALSIYDALQRRDPGDLEVATRLAALRRRLAGVDSSPPPAHPHDTEPPTAWRLLDPATLQSPQETVQHLRRATRDARDEERTRRHRVVGEPPAPPPAPEEPLPAPEDVSRGHPDFQRFLAYVRSLRREDGT